MKLLVDVLAGVFACGVAYYLALPGTVEQDAATAVKREADGEPRGDNDRRQVAGVAGQGLASPAGPSTAAGVGIDAGASVQQRTAMNLLRNEVITAAAADMHRRGESVMKCLEDVDLAGAQKLRFSVDVVSTPVEATTGQWRFVEIVDGEPLPDSFASCAARAFGGGQRVVPPRDFRFPDYRGDLSTLYTIPAPADD